MNGRMMTTHAIGALAEKPMKFPDGGSRWGASVTAASDSPCHSPLRILAVSPHDLSGLAEARYPTLATALSAMYHGP